MDDAFLMRLALERLGDLSHNGKRLGYQERPARQAISEGTALDQLERQGHHAIGFLQAVEWHQYADALSVARSRAWRAKRARALGHCREVPREGILPSPGHVAPRGLLSRAR